MRSLYLALLSTWLLPGTTFLQAQDTTCGIVWDEPIMLSDTTYDAYSPKIALSGDDTVHITWENSTLQRPRLPYTRSTDGGSSFLPARELLVDSGAFPYPSAWNLLVAGDKRVYIFFVGSTGTDTPVRMVLSTDAGSSWSEPRNIGSDSAGVLSSVALCHDTLSLVYPPRGDYRKILRSTNAGQTWTRTNENLDLYARIALSHGILHLVQNTPAFPEVEYRQSTDLGNTWRQRRIISQTDAFWSDLPNLATDTGSTVFALWREARFGCLGVFGCSISARRGVGGPDSTSWLPETVLTPSPRGSSPVAALTGSVQAVVWQYELTPSDTIHVAGRFSVDSDLLRCGMVDLTPMVRTALNPAVAISRTRVHVVWEQGDNTGRGTFQILYRRGIFLSDNTEAPGDLPGNFRLDPNYPNPFNPATTIRYGIEKRLRVSLKVFDVLGREVATLADEVKEPGQYTVEWNAGDLPSGVYFYRLIAGARIETRKAIILK